MYSKYNQLQLESLKTEIESIKITNPELEFISSCEQDIKAVQSVHNVEYASAEFNVEIGKVIETYEIENGFYLDIQEKKDTLEFYIYQI